MSRLRGTRSVGALIAVLEVWGLKSLHVFGESQRKDWDTRTHGPVCDCRKIEMSRRARVGVGWAGVGWSIERGLATAGMHEGCNS